MEGSMAMYRYGSPGRRRFAACFALLAILLLTFCPARADEAGFPRQVTLKDCLKAALANYSSLRIAREQVKVAEYDKEAAFSPLLPRVTAGTSYTTGNTVVNGPGTFDTRKTTVSYTQTYMDGGLTRLAVEKADIGIKSSKEGYTLTRQDLEFNVTSTFFTLLQSQAQVRFTIEDVDRARHQLDLVRARIRAGDAAEVDRYPLEVELSKTELNAITAANLVLRTSNSLRNLMGVPPGPPLEASTDFGEVRDVPSLADAQKEALKRRAEIMQLEDAVASLGKDKARVDLGNRPIFNLSGAAGQGIGSWTSPWNQWSVNANVSVLIFDSGLTTNQLRRSDSQIRIALEQLAQKRTDILLEVEQSHIALDTATKSLPASRTLLVSAQKNLEVQEAKYKAGLATTLDLIQARTDYANAEFALLQAQINYLNARAALQKSMGKAPLED